MDFHNWGTTSGIEAWKPPLWLLSLPILMAMVPASVSMYIVCNDRLRVYCPARFTVGSNCPIASLWL